MRLTSVYILATCVAAASVSSPGAQGRGGSPSDDPVVTIDGAKNPEQIPEWAAWQEAFRYMAQPAEPEIPIPTRIWRVTSPEQRAWLRKEALRVLARDRELLARVLKLRDGLNADNTGERSARVDALEMERRRAALEARDSVLVSLPEAQVELRGFVEEVRKGYKLQIQKSKIPQFMLPE